MTQREEYEKYWDEYERSNEYIQWIARDKQKQRIKNVVGICMIITVIVSLILTIPLIFNQ